MRIEFRKVPKNGDTFELKKDNLVFHGELKKINAKTLSLNGEIKGSLACICDRCAETFDLVFDEKVTFKVIDGIINEEHDDLDIVESFDQRVDLDTIFLSEIESKKCDYHCCDKCSIQ